LVVAFSGSGVEDFVMSSGSGAVVIVVSWIVVLANYPYCCQEQAVAVVDHEMVVAFSGSGVTDFVVSSGSSIVVIIVFGFVLFKLDIWGLLLKIDSVIRLFFHKQGVVIVNDDLVLHFLFQVLQILLCHLVQVL